MESLNRGFLEGLFSSISPREYSARNISDFMDDRAKIQPLHNWASFIIPVKDSVLIKFEQGLRFSYEGEKPCLSGLKETFYNVSLDMMPADKRMALEKERSCRIERVEALYDKGKDLLLLTRYMPFKKRVNQSGGGDFDLPDEVGFT